MQFYNSKIPIKEEIVLVKFTNILDSYIKGELLEYEMECFLNFSDATKKKRIFCWNKILKLNKKYHAKILNIVNENIVQVSLLYLYESINIHNPQEYITNYFKYNTMLYKLTKTFCIINNYDFNEFWNNVIHFIDKLRMNENTTDLKISIYTYIIENITNLINCINDNEKYNEISKKYFEYINEKNNTNDKIIYKKNLNILSLYNIIYIKDIFDKIIEMIDNNDIHDKLNIIYISSGKYLLTCNNETILNNFLHYLNIECNNTNNNLKLLKIS